MDKTEEAGIHVRARGMAVPGPSWSGRTPGTRQQLVGGGGAAVAEAFTAGAVDSRAKALQTRRE